MKITQLTEFGEKVLGLFDEYVARTNIKLDGMAVVRHYVTQLNISESGFQCQWSSEITREPFWAVTISDFVEKTVRNLPEFQLLASNIAKRYKNNINEIVKGSNEAAQSKFWLEQFVTKLVLSKLDSTFSKDTLVECASLFLKELELSSVDHQFIYHLSGIFLESDSVIINDTALIRKVQPKDLEYKTYVFADIFGPTLGHMPSGHMPSAILQISTFTRDERAGRDCAEKIMNSLRLFKVGSVYPLESIYKKSSVIWPAAEQRSFGRTSYFNAESYTVKSQDIDVFVKFTNSIMEKIITTGKEKGYPLFLSLERYTSALLDAIDTDRRLMTAVMGLEALYTLRKERGENAYKLGIRVAKMLGKLNYDPLAVKSRVEKAYALRNDVVHGAPISIDDRKTMGEILPHILNYLRVSLVIFLLGQDIGKDRLVALVNDSTVNDLQDKELNSLVNKFAEEFKEVILNPAKQETNRGV